MKRDILFCRKNNYSVIQPNCSSVFPAGYLVHAHRMGGEESGAGCMPLSYVKTWWRGMVAPPMEIWLSPKLPFGLRRERSVER